MADRRQGQADHDLLIELRTEMAEVRKDIKNLGDNLVGRVVALETGCVSKLEMEKTLTTLAQTLRQEAQLNRDLQNAEISRLSKIVYGACALVLTAFIVTLLK